MVVSGSVASEFVSSGTATCGAQSPGSVSSWISRRSTPHRAVERLVRRRWGQVQRGEFELCMALRRLYLDNVHRHAGYADQEFEIPGKLADLFCLLARHLERLPKTREALERGTLTYTKAREFV